MEETNRQKINLDALKLHRANNTPKKTVTTTINTTNVINSVSKSSESTSQAKIYKPNDIQTTKITTPIENKTHITIVKPISTIKKTISPIATKINTENSNNDEKHKTINNAENNNNEINSNVKENRQETTNKTNLSEILIKNEKKLFEKKDDTGEIFSGYTSDFSNKKDQALKESKKIKFPDSPKKIFFAIFTSLLILSSLALIIIFKIDNSTTNKLKINILELVGKKEKQSTKKVANIWKKLIYKSIGFNIDYEISNTNKYKIDGKILNNENEFNNYIKDKIEKLKIEKLKQHLQEEKKIAN